jgi:hypothetical protein
MRRHPVVLEKAIQRVEASPYKRQLNAYLNRAYYLKKHQNELDTYVHLYGLTFTFMKKINSICLLICRFTYNNNYSLKILNTNSTCLPDFDARVVK